MTLEAGFISVTNRDALGVPEGEYLELKDNNGNLTYYSIEDFREKLEIAATPNKGIVIANKVGIGVAGNPKQVINEYSKPSFEELVKAIKDLLHQNNIVASHEERYVEVVSDSSLLLELPWEDIVGKYVIRVVSNSKKSNLTEKENILVVMSHAHNNVRDKIVETIKKEVNQLYESLEYFVDEHKLFEKVLLIKHGSLDNIHSNDYKDFGYMHFAMHCDENGLFWLESNGDHYKTPDPHDIDVILGMVPRNYLFKLIYFSSCYTAGGLSDNAEPAAFKVVREGVAQVSLGYRYGAGNLDAKGFSDYFYKYLKVESKKTGGQMSILETFLRTLEKTNTTKSLPILYTSNGLNFKS